MAAGVLPSPVALPLPGGRDGATVRVHPLHTADMHSTPAIFDRPAGRGWMARALAVPRSRWLWLPVPAFLVEHPEAGPFLVDTGVHADVATSPRASFGRRGALVLRVRMEASWAVPSRLRERGFDVADINLVVMTHLHYDHVGGASQLPNATFVVDEREWDAAARGRLLDGYRPALVDHPHLTWRTYAFDGASERHGAFTRTMDLFGDGSVRLLSTPGHTAGHVSLLLRLTGGRHLLLAADAAYARRTLEHELVALFTQDVPAYRRSLGQIREWVADHPGDVFVGGHDPWSWPDLPEVFE